MGDAYTTPHGYANGSAAVSTYPVGVDVAPRLTQRNRLTCAFRPILAIPHLLLVGGPAVYALSLVWRSDRGPRLEWGVGTGVLGAVAAVCALIAWFAIMLGGRYPGGLWALATFYLRWRVRSGAYLALLRDEYPPFGDDVYPAALVFRPPTTAHDRLTVAFRIVLAIPHLLAVWVLGLAWGITTVIAWANILITRGFPAPLYTFGVGVLRWSTRLEAYLLLLTDEYPPFTLDED